MQVDPQAPKPSSNKPYAYYARTVTYHIASATDTHEATAAAISCTKRIVVLQSVSQVADSSLM